MPRNLMLSHRLAVGDNVVATALPRDIALAYPGEFKIAFDCQMAEVWANNPYIVPKEEVIASGDWDFVRLDYSAGLYDQKWRPCHFLEYFHRDFTAKTGIEVPLSAPYPDLHLTETEKANPEYPQRYWVVFAGGKADVTLKVWNWKFFQEVVNEIKGMGLEVIQSGGRGKAPAHIHYPLENCIHDLDRADLRQLFRLIYHAEGVICGITGPMHIAAALHRPCIVLGGGREAWWWEAYVRENPGFSPEIASKLVMPHTYLHTIGLLDCCSHFGCWRNKVVQIDDDKSLCKLPVLHDHQAVAACMEMIKPEHVMKAVRAYYSSSLLPPITPIGDMPVISQQPASIEQDPFEHPLIGGKMAFCMTMFGPSEYLSMQQKALTSILSTVPRNRRSIRIAANALSPDGVKWLSRLKEDGEIDVLHIHKTNIFKYPAMRQLLAAKEGDLPQWLMWFDDDTIADVSPTWIKDVCRALVAIPPDCAAIGKVLSSRLAPEQVAFYRTRPWYKGKPFFDKDRKESPTGDVVYFLHGAWWAMRTSVLRELDIPDSLLMNNGGDICIGEMLHQGGYRIANCPEVVRISTAPRRGESQPHFGSRDWQARFGGQVGQAMSAPARITTIE